MQSFRSFNTFNVSQVLYEERAKPISGKRMLKIKFNADVSQTLDWKFAPQQHNVNVSIVSGNVLQDSAWVEAGMQLEGSVQADVLQVSDQRCMTCQLIFSPRFSQACKYPCGWLGRPDIPHACRLLHLK